MSNGQQPTLHAVGLTLRPWAAADAPALVSAYSDPAIQQWNMRALNSNDEPREWVKRWGERWRAETDVSWAITSEATGDLMGYLALRDTNLEFGRAQLTYWVIRAFRGEGVATRAAEEAVRWALEDVGLHRVELHHAVANVPSCRIADKVGFILEGTMRSALLHSDGWHDMHLHARTGLAG